MVCNCLDYQRIQIIFLIIIYQQLSACQNDLSTIIKHHLDGKNCIQILFQHTATLIYTTTKLVSFTTS